MPYMTPQRLPYVRWTALPHSLVRVARSRPKSPDATFAANSPAGPSGPGPDDWTSAIPGLIGDMSLASSDSRAARERAVQLEPSAYSRSFGVRESALISSVAVSPAANPYNAASAGATGRSSVRINSTLSILKGL